VSCCLRRVAILLVVAAAMILTGELYCMADEVGAPVDIAAAVTCNQGDVCPANACTGTCLGARTCSCASGVCNCV
jgi:hypothetical protein